MSCPRLIFSLAVLAACTPYEQVAETGRYRPELRYTEAEMRRLGDWVFATSIEPLDLITATTYAANLEEIARRLRPVAELDPATVFELRLAPESIGVLYVPSGRVAVLTGSLVYAETPGELAFLVAHGIAHGKLGHPNERLREPPWFRVFRGHFQSENRIWELVSPEARAAVSAAFGIRDPDSTLPAWSLEHQREADGVALNYVRGAGYDPITIPALLERLATASAANLGDYGSDRDQLRSRARRIRRLLARND